MSDEAKAKGHQNGVGWSTLTLPLIAPLAFTAGILSAPFSQIGLRNMRRREEVFRAQMRASNRIIEWADFAKALDEDLGTPIEERYSVRGPVRWWWASENIREHSPYPFSDWASMLKDDKFAPFSKWCHERYTSSETGGAMLVCPPPDTERASLVTLAKDLKTKTNRWIDAVPPEVLAQRQKSASGTTPNT